MRENPRTLTWIFIFIAVMSAAAVVIAALISSAPPPPPSSALSSTPATPQQLIQSTSSAGSLLFFEDFEDGVAEGIKYIYGDWKVTTDNDGNKVYEVDNRQNTNYPGFDFGSGSWTNYIVEYRVRC